MKNEPAIIILAAGKGTRLGGPVPKPLTRLIDGRTILQQQLDNITLAFGHDALKRTFVVVGFQAEKIVNELPKRVHIVYNDQYDTSNTAKSLLRALQASDNFAGAIWMNGDVVFSPLALGRAIASINQQVSFMAVVEGKTDDEEMKYSLSDSGSITQVSKNNLGGLGEAVGINFVSAKDRDYFIAALNKVDAEAYFEAAIEQMLRRGWILMPLFVTDLYAVEIDVIEDLVRANLALTSYSHQYTV